jgi:hypothetical protein
MRFFSFETFLCSRSGAFNSGVSILNHVTLKLHQIRIEIIDTLSEQTHQLPCMIMAVIIKVKQ